MTNIINIKMNEEIIVYKNNPLGANIEQLSIKREWMEQTANKHAYQCMPVSLTNTMGWGISFPKEISFIWDGVSDTTPDHIKILNGPEYCNVGRANGTLSFNTYLTFKTKKNITMLAFPVPNEFNENAQCFTTLISTSFYKSSFPIAWKILKPNVKITIPANKPVAAIIPISLKELENFEITIKEKNPPLNYKKEEINNLEFYRKKSKQGKFGHLYRKAENFKGEKVGDHEVQSIKLKTTKQ
jgi:hypothetical protein